MVKESKRDRARSGGGGSCLSQRRTIISYYRKIENTIHEGKDEIANGNSDKFMAIINDVDTMHSQVENPREQVADAEALLGLTSSLMASVKTHTTGDLTPAEFVSCLIRNFGKQKSMKANSTNILWKNMGVFVSRIFMNGHGCRTMIGPLKIELKVQKLPVRAKRPRSTKKDVPKELENAAEVVTDTDRNVQMMFNILKKKRKVRVENLMLNKGSFAQTVENLFALSFLVKDGRVRVDVDEGGSQAVVPTNGPSAEDIKSGAAKSHQFIFRFDFNDWKLMKTIVPEGEELMQKRDTVTVTGFSQPTTETGGKCSSLPEAIPIVAEIARAAPIKKFSRNYCHSTQNYCLTEMVNDINWNSDYKFKRSVL